MVTTSTDRVYGESSGLAVKAPVIAVAVTNLALNGLVAVGAYQTQQNDRILVTGQTDPTQNGIYYASSSAWQRTGDFDGPYDFIQGTLVAVANPPGASIFYQLTTPSPVIGQPLNFALVSVPLPFPLTPAEIAAQVVPAGLQYLPGPNPAGNIQRYGAVYDGVTDCTAALVAACKVGGDITISGPIALASASLAALPNSAISILLPSRIRCTNGGSITVTGNTPCNVFYSTNVSGIKFVDVDATGNGVATASTGYFWYCKATGGAGGPTRNLKYIRGSLTNFSGYYWLYFDNTGATTYPMRDVRIVHTDFFSAPGNAQGPGNIAVPAAVIGFSGSDTVLTFETMRDCHVKDCTADGTYIKTFVDIWSGTFRIKSSGNTLHNFGTDASFSNDAGCYAFNVYDHSHGTGITPDLIEISSNIIDGVRSCGVYSAGANRLEITNLRVTGQTDNVTAVIPKGAVALNGVKLPTVKGLIADSCLYGLVIDQGPDATAFARAYDITVHNLPTNGIALWLSGTTGGNANDIKVDGLNVHIAAGAVGTRGVHIVATSTVGINNLAVENFNIVGCANAIDLFAPDSTVPALGNVRIAHGVIRGATVNCLQWLNATNAATLATFDDITFAGMIAGAVGFYAANAVGLTIRNILFEGLGSGATYCWYGGGAQGRLSGMQFAGVATANRFDGSANRLGVDAPGFNGNDNDFIQFLDINEQGAAASKYVRLGWTWDRVAAAWKECRALTGN